MNRMDEFRQQLQSRMAALRTGNFSGVYSVSDEYESDMHTSDRSCHGDDAGTAIAERHSTTVCRKVGLCIGINEVSSQAYPSAAKLTLHGCCNDADRFGRLLQRLGYSVNVLKDSRASRAGVERCLNEAAGYVVESDMGIGL